MLFEIELGFIVKVYYQIQENHSKWKRNRADILKKRESRLIENTLLQWEHAWTLGALYKEMNHTQGQILYYLRWRLWKFKLIKKNKYKTVVTRGQTVEKMRCWSKETGFQLQDKWILESWKKAQGNRVCALHIRHPGWILGNPGSNSQAQSPTIVAPEKSHKANVNKT